MKTCKMKTCILNNYIIFAQRYYICILYILLYILYIIYIIMYTYNILYIIITI